MQTLLQNTNGATSYGERESFFTTGFLMDADSFVLQDRAPHPIKKSTIGPELHLNCRENCQEYLKNGHYPNPSSAHRRMVR